MLLYLLQVSLSLALFYLAYLFLLKNDTFFRRNRYYLIISSLFSLIAPLIPDWVSLLGRWLTPFMMQDELLEGRLMLETLVVSADRNTEFMQSSLWWYIYAGGVIAMLFQLIYQSGKLMLFVSKKGYKKIDAMKVVHTHGQYPTFAFGPYLFWDNSKNLDQEQSQSIWIHEKKHIHDLHTADILFFEAMKAFFWFNPFIYFYATAIKDQHEFIADAAVVTTTKQASNYRKIIVQSLFEELQLSVTHSFNQSQIQKRLIMMRKNKSKLWKHTKVLVALPLVILLAFGMEACQQDVDASKPLYEITLNDGTEVSFNSDKELKAYFDANNVSKKDIATLNINKRTFDDNESYFMDGEEVYEMTDEMAEPAGGMKQFYKQIGSHLIYPQKAKEDGVEGKVYLQFIIDKYGNLSSLTVVKGLSTECDQAAIEAFKSSFNQWKPAVKNGKNVAQRLVLPINFSLDDC